MEARHYPCPQGSHSLMGKEGSMISQLFGHLSINIPVETESRKKLVDQIMSFADQFLYSFK